MHSRLRAIYLAAIAVGVFFMPSVWMVGAAAALQVVLWLALGLGPKALFRQIRKLIFFLAVIFIAYALVGTGEAGQSWHKIGPVDVSLDGVRIGTIMLLRIVCVVLASHVARAGDPTALGSGLRGLGMPRMASLAIDTVLALFGDSGRGRGKGTGRGRGKGGGGGRGRRKGGAQQAGDGDAMEGDEHREEEVGFRQALRRLARGDVGVLADRLFAHVERATDYITDRTGENDRALARDVAVISGVALTMLSIKVLKLLPGLPFAPGHKGVLLIPLYFVAARMTRTRLGATWTGLTMGSVAFLMGDGRWGIFEILKHVAPGLIADLLVPAVSASAGRLAWALVGMLSAVGRFATVSVIALTVQPPAVVYALLVPGLLIHATFGVLSAVVTAPLMQAIDARSRKGDAPKPLESS